VANIRRSYVRWRGLDWHPDVPEHQRHLKLWKRWREYPEANLLDPISEHLFRALEVLFTPDQLIIHPWMEVQAYSWTYDEFALWWGCAGSGKSHTLGLLALLDYLTDPDCTYTCLASTTKQMLEVRSFASVVQYLTYLKGNRTFAVPFRYLRQPRMEIVPANVNDEDLPNLKHKIVGVAVRQGTVEQARGNLQGVHTRYVRLLLDELSAMPPAAMEARHNLAQCFDFKLVGACNPESLYDQAGQFSVPKSGSWSEVDLDTDKWESQYGMVYRFDSFKSPGLEDPDKYFFLPNKKTIDRMLQQNAYNQDAPQVWTMLRAFPAPQGMERTVITEAMVSKYGMMDTATWKKMPTKIAGFDPAFTADGDNAKLVTANVGFDERGIRTLCFDKLHHLQIKASDERPVLEQLVDQVVGIMLEEGISIQHLGVDDSGTQSVADAIEMRIAKGKVYRTSFSSRAPEVPVSIANETPASKKYRDTATWTHFLIYEYALRGQIRGMPIDAVQQMCRRRLQPKARLIAMESKDDYKQRTGLGSPDDADACAICAAVARMVLGLMPGSSEWQKSDKAPMQTLFLPGFVNKVNNLTTDYRSTI
jgi:hypothetical protein